MSGFVKINFDAVDDFNEESPVSPSSADEFFESDDFFMDDSSNDSFIMVDEVDYDESSLPVVSDSLADDSSVDHDSVADDNSVDEPVIKPLFKRSYTAGNDYSVRNDSVDDSISKVSAEPEYGNTSVEGVGSSLIGDGDVSRDFGVSSEGSNSVDSSLSNDSLDFGDGLKNSSSVASFDGTGLSDVPVALRRGDAYGAELSSVPDIVNPLLLDDDEEDALDFSKSSVNDSLTVDSGIAGKGGSVEGSTGGVSSVGIVNPFLMDDEDEDAPFLGFGKGASKSIEEDFIGTVVNDTVVESGGVDSSVAGSGFVSRDEVREIVDSSVSVEEFSVPVESVDEGVAGEVSVVVHKRGPRFVESDFRRQNVSEVVVDSSVVDDAKREKQRYRYVREDGRLNGAELEFFKRLGVSRRDRENEDERLRVLRGRVDGVDTVAARKARNVLYGQAIGADDMLKRGSKMRFSEMDRDVLQFLAKFRYVKDEHLGIAFNRASSTMYSRLKKLRTQGLVIDKKVYGSRPIWFLTEAGMLLSGYDVARVTEGKMSTMMFPHQFTVNHIAANVWGANVNVLNLEDFPARNRVDAKGNPVFGERLIGEVEIQTSFGRMKMFDKAEVFVPELKANVDRAFEKWEKSGGVGFGESPEFQMGNEYMWALLPPASLRKAYHVPDLVVVRPRNEDGSPESIAVEVEINNKDTESYEKVLRAYRADDRIFKKVIWVCKSIGPARKLETVAKNIGLWQEGRIEILPVITEHGIFKERDMWFI